MVIADRNEKLSIVDIMIANKPVKNKPLITGGNIISPKVGYAITGVISFNSAAAYSPDDTVNKSNINQKQMDIKIPVRAFSGETAAEHL